MTEASRIEQLEAKVERLQSEVRTLTECIKQVNGALAAHSESLRIVASMERQRQVQGSTPAR